MASMALPQPGEVYNVADDDPSSRETVMDYVHTHFQIGQAAGPEGTKVLQASRSVCVTLFVLTCCKQIHLRSTLLPAMAQRNCTAVPC